MQEPAADIGLITRIVQGTMVVVFFCMILAPGIAMLIAPGQEVSQTEKRQLAPFPEIRLSKEFPREFENYFNDHLGFRSWFILAHHYLLLKVFRMSPVDHVISGRDGWLFYAGDRLREDFTGQDPFPDAMLDQWETVLKQRIQYLEKQGVKYLLVVAPNKQTIYPEFLPGWIRKQKGKTRFDQLKERLDTRGIHCLVDLRSALTAGKSDGQLYFSTDTHWNSMGALIAAEEIAGRLEQLFPGERFFDRASILLAEPEPGIARDLATMVGLERVMVEKEPARVAFLHPCAKSDAQLKLPYVGPGYYEVPFARHCPGRTRKAVVFRDSFTNFLEPFLSEMFETVVYIWKRYDPDIMSSLLEEIQPDIVIEESVERFLLTPPR